MTQKSECQRSRARVARRVNKSLCELRRSASWLPAPALFRVLARIILLVQYSVLYSKLIQVLPRGKSARLFRQENFQETAAVISDLNIH